MEWKTVKLGELVNRKIRYGIVQPGISVPKGIPVVKVFNIVSGLNDVRNLDTTTYEIDKKYPKTKLAGGELILSVVGTVGKTAIAPKSFAGCNIGRSTAMIDIPDPMMTYWVKYYIDSPLGQEFINANLNTTVQSVLNIKSLVEMPIRLYSTEYMRKVSSFLSSLDDKIENNNRINCNLEAQAQALFKSWFVDFEPFGGTMPEDWKFDDISNIPHVLETGRRPKGGAVESGVPSIGAEHIKGMGTYDFSKTKYITEDYARSMKSGKINGYELLIYKDGGKPGYFIPNFTIYGEGYPFEECYINEHVLKLDFPSKAYNIFCYFYFQTPEVMNYLNARGGKAAIPGINKSDIDNINILTPDNNTVVQFGEIVLPYFTSILQNLAENKRLAALRDTLLPKLMRGEITL